MSIFRKPLGAYMRNTPDWFASNAAAGSGFDNAAFGVQPAVGLFNNDSIGRSLYVYATGAAPSGGSGQCQAVLLNGPLGSLYDFTFGTPQTFPIDPLLGQPVGQIMVSLTAAQYNATFAVQQPGMYLFASAGGPGPQSTPVFPDYPLAIVRPGYTFAWYTVSGGPMGAFFYYVVLQ